MGSRLDRIRERLNAASRIVVSDYKFGSGKVRPVVRIGVYDTVLGDEDADFIAHAPTDIRDLLAVAEAAKNEWRERFSPTTPAEAIASSDARTVYTEGELKMAAALAALGAEEPA